MWLGGYPKASKTTADTVAALQHFAGPDDKVKLFYSDGSQELEGAAKTLMCRHDTSTAYRPQANGVAERAVGRAVEGCRAVLYASGFWTPLVGRRSHNLLLHSEHHGHDPKR